MNRSSRISLVAGLTADEHHNVDKLENIKEAEYTAKMAALNEKRLICWAVKICVIPCIFISLLATFFPYPQAMVPVHESQDCICHFLNDANHRNYVLMDLTTNDVDLVILQVLNVTMFFGINWVFLLMIVRSVYHVRHIKDRLEIRKEMTYIVVLWSVFCLLQYCWYLIGQAGSEGCAFGDLTNVGFLIELDYLSRILTYYTILFRDLTVLLITVVFLIFVGRRENSLKQQLKMEENLLDVMDL